MVRLGSDFGTYLSNLILASGFVPFLNDILSRAVPLFSHIKQDPIKGAWSQALCAFCESVIESGTGNEVSVPGRTIKILHATADKNIVLKNFRTQCYPYKRKWYIRKKWQTKFW
jgi:hypothetical protein